MTTVHSISHFESEFIECLRDAFLIQHVREPTRSRPGQRPSILDLVLTNEEQMVSNLTYLSLQGKSDHAVLTFEFNCYIENS